MVGWVATSDSKIEIQMIIPMLVSAMRRRRSTSASRRLAPWRYRAEPVKMGLSFTRP